MRDWGKTRDRLRRNLPGRLLLGAAALVYGFIMMLRRRLYEAKVLKSRRLRAKVVCIGNLTTGGTGKTPAVLLAAQTLRKRNHSVAILSRGYGRSSANGEVTTLLDDEPPPWTECGDEPWMMHHALQGESVPILVSADRTKAGERAVAYYHSRLLILDDGFQHLKLKRDLDIVLINATDPFGGGKLLPLGNLREPLSALSRASMILITHADAVSPEAVEAIRERVKKLNRRAPILESIHKPDFLLDIHTSKRHRLTHLAGKKVAAFCGLADPLSFEGLLGRMDVEIAQRWRYPDHYPFTLADLKSISRVADGMPIVTTFKDFTRFPANWRDFISGEFYMLAIKLEILKGRQEWTESLLKLVGDAP